MYLFEWWFCWDQNKLRRKGDIQLTRKLSLYDLIKVADIWVIVFSMQTCAKHFSQITKFRTFSKVFDASQNCNHTLLDIVWSQKGFSYQGLIITFRFIFKTENTLLKMGLSVIRINDYICEVVVSVIMR